MMTTMLGADLIVETLKREGIRHIFSLPGGQLLPVYYAAKDDPDMETIFCRHEGAATLMASGYSMIAGQPSCVMATVGAGIAYEVGPLFFAWRERLPVLSIAPQVQSFKMKPIQENLQACDQDEIFKPITKFNAIMYHPERIPYLIKRAVKAAVAPDPGPVHLDVPVDVMYGYRKITAAKRKVLFDSKKSRYDGDICPLPASLQKAVERIASAKRPLLLAGRALERCRGGKELMEFLKMSSVPAILSSAAFSTLPFDCEHHLGSVSLWNGENGAMMLSRADLIVLIEPDEEVAHFCRRLHDNARMEVIHVSACEAQTGTIVPGETSIYGSPSRVLSDMTVQFASVKGGNPSDEQWIRDLKKIQEELRDAYFQVLSDDHRASAIKTFLEALGTKLQPDDIIVSEGGAASEILISRLQRSGMHNTFILNNDVVAGAGLPVAIGMKSARKDQRVILLTVAPLFKHHMRELQTMARYGSGVAVFIFKGTTEKGAEEVNFASFAEALGVPAITLKRSETAFNIEKSCLDSKGIVFDATDL